MNNVGTTGRRTHAKNTAEPTTEPGDGSLTLSPLAASIPAAEARRALAWEPRPRLYSYEPIGLRNKQPLQRLRSEKVTSSLLAAFSAARVSHMFK